MMPVNSKYSIRQALRRQFDSNIQNVFRVLTVGLLMRSCVVVSINCKYTENNNIFYFRRHIINIDISYIFNICIYCTNKKFESIIVYMILQLS